MTETPVLDALRHEVRAVQLEDGIVNHVRVSRDAIPGSLTSARVPPERLEEVGVYGRYDDGAIVDEEDDHDRMHEILVHPLDWSALLKERLPEGPYVVVHPAGAKRRVLGLTVLES